VPTRIGPPRLGALATADLDAIAERLCRARNPAIVAAEDVHWHGASSALRDLADALDAAVYAAPYTGVLPLDAASARFAGYLSPGFRSIGARLAEHDLIVFAGGRTLRTTLYAEIDLPQPKIWLGDDPSVLALGAEFERAHLVDLRAALSALAGAAAERRGAAAPERPARRESARPESRPGALHPTLAVKAVLEGFRDAIVFDEAGLSTSDVRQW